MKMQFIKLARLTVAFILNFLVFSSIPSHVRGQTDSVKEKTDTIIENLSKKSGQDFINIYRSAQKRVPDNIIKMINDSNRKLPKDSKQKHGSQGMIDSPAGLKEENELTKHQNLPQNIIFPGEFEEVRAILIAWPYITVDTNGYFVWQTFKDVVVAGNIPNTDIFYTYPVRSYIDSFPQSPIAAVFSKVIHAIDDNAEVWINVWEDKDTAVVQRYMESRSMPLKHARFFVNVGSTYWYRDSGPIAFYYGTEDSLGFLDFQYYSGRPLDDSIPIYIGKKLGIPVFTSTLEHEGGNVIEDGLGNLFNSDIVYLLNQVDDGQFYMDEFGLIHYPHKTPLTPEQVCDSLKRLFQANYMMVPPMLRWDGGTGHLDMYMDMTDENNFVLTKYPDALKNFEDYHISSANGDSIIKIIRSDSEHYTKAHIPFPKKDDSTWYKNQEEYGRFLRSYSNHVFVNKAIIQPVFADDTSGDRKSMQEDLDSIKAQYPGYNIVPVDVRSFDGFGGAIHCITKQIPADNPLRILHVPVKSNEKPLPSYIVNATITNKSGIKSAFVNWRYVGDSTWKVIPMVNLTSDLKKFTGSITNDYGSGMIEYYLSAISNNGKTMTKPITAPSGTYKFLVKKPNSVTENSWDVVPSYLQPNPFTFETILKINPKKTVINAELKIYDLLGIIRIKLSGINSNEIRLKREGLSQGMYFYQLSNPEGIISGGKLLVE
jgi:agmatine/peptidylarginine deiminase